ncbi:MAG: gluconate:H+ symporter [Bacillota bacterium]
MTTDFDTTRVLIASACGIIILLILIIKFKVHPVLSLLVAALVIAMGSGMTVEQMADTVTEGAGSTLEGIVLLIGLGSMFGGILEVSGGASSIARTLVAKFGEKNSGIALGVTGLIIGTTVFFEAGVMILIPLAFGLAKKTKKSTLYYVIPLLAGLAAGFAFIPPSAGSVLVSTMLGVDLGLMILVGLPTGVVALVCGGIFWSKFIGKRIYAAVPDTVKESNIEEANLPKFSTVVAIILIPLVLILLSTLTTYVEIWAPLESTLLFLGTPFIALIITIIVAMFTLCHSQGYTLEQIKKILDKSLLPTAGILLVITGGGIISEILQVIGMGSIVSSVLEQSGLPLVIVAFLIAGMIRICVGAAVVSMTMTAGIMVSMVAVSTLSPLYLAAIVLAINGGATAFSHFNDSGFWMVSSILQINEKDTLKAWTTMETIIGLVGLASAVFIALLLC